jgi:hypothetical protein
MPQAPSYAAGFIKYTSSQVELETGKSIKNISQIDKLKGTDQHCSGLAEAQC